MKTMKIYLARHGQSVFNAENRFSGHGNPLLTARGKKQAEKAGKFFSGKNIEAIFYSDLKRASETAKIISKQIKKTKMFEQKILREMNFGKWEGKKVSELKGEDAKIEKKWRKNHFSERVPCGESFKDLEKRLAPLAKKILASKLENILIVSHSGTTMILLKIFLKLDEKKAMKIRAENNAVFEITIRGKTRSMKKTLL